MTLNELLEWPEGVTTQIVTPTTQGYNCPTLKASSGKGDWNSYLTTATGFSVPGVFCVAEDTANHHAENQFAKYILQYRVNNIIDSEKDVFKFLFYMFVKQCNKYGGAIENDSVEMIKSAVLSLTDNQYIFLRPTTPRERYRFMGISDEDIDKLLQSKLSDSAHYKLAGNSIVVNVIERIFENMFHLKKSNYDEKD